MQSHSHGWRILPTEQIAQFYCVKHVHLIHSSLRVQLGKQLSMYTRISPAKVIANTRMHRSNNFASIALIMYGGRGVCTDTVECAQPWCQWQIILSNSCDGTRHMAIPAVQMGSLLREQARHVNVVPGEDTQWQMCKFVQRMGEGLCIRYTWVR